MTDRQVLRFRNDPLAFLKFGWPQVVLYSKQREILESIRDNDETVVVAGNMLGRLPPLGCDILGGGNLEKIT